MVRSEPVWWWGGGGGGGEVGGVGGEGSGERGIIKSLDLQVPSA